MNDRPRYCIIPADAVFDPELSQFDLKVLAALGTYANRNGWCVVKQGTVATAIGSTAGSVRNAMAKLTARGYLKKRARFGSNGSQLACEYQVVMDRDPPADSVDDEAAEMTAPPALDNAPPPHSPMRPPRIGGCAHKNDPSYERPSSDEDREGRARAAGRGSRLPDDFRPDLRWASEQGMSPAEAERERERFFDHWRATPGQRGVKRDWQATWRNWVRNALDRRPPPRRASSSRPADDGLLALCRGELTPSITGGGHVVEHE